MFAYAIEVPTPTGWQATGTHVAGRNVGEAASEAASYVGRGNAFRVQPVTGLNTSILAHPAEPLDYNARANATARMVNPAYLSTAQLHLAMAATEADLDGQPF